MITKKTMTDKCGRSVEYNFCDALNPSLIEQLNKTLEFVRDSSLPGVYDSEHPLAAARMDVEISILRFIAMSCSIVYMPIDEDSTL